MDSPSKLFDANYFATGCGRPYARDEVWFHFFGSVAEHIIAAIQPGTVLDAGCAWGFLVEMLRQRGVQAFGVDVSEYAIQNVAAEMKPFCWVGSVAEPFPQKYDLITCIEVLEHMPQAESEKAIENLCRFTDDILFSSTPFDYKEATHFNVQPPEYWAEMFARQGFYRDVDFDASFLTAWAARFHRKSDPTARLVREYERRFFLLWKENSDLRSLVGEMRDQLSGSQAMIQTLNESVQSQALALDALRPQVTERDKQIQALNTRVMDLGQTADTLHKQLTAVYDSRTFRFMNKLHQLRKLIPRLS